MLFLFPHLDLPILCSTSRSPTHSVLFLLHSKLSLMALLSTVLGFSVFGLASRFGQLAIQRRNLMDSMLSQTSRLIHISDDVQIWLGMPLQWLHSDMRVTGCTTTKYEQTSSLHGNVRKSRPGWMLKEKRELQEQLDVGCVCSRMLMFRHGVGS